MEATALDTTLNHYLSFSVDNDLYALNVGQVREVLELVPITKVPRMPEFIRGIINLRGKVVPVIDMRTKFGMANLDATIDTRVVVVESGHDDQVMLLGALVDSVSEVLEIKPESIQPAPTLGLDLNTDFIRGVGRHNDDSFIIILDIDKVFSTAELTLVKQAGVANAGQPEGQDS